MNLNSRLLRLAKRDLLRGATPRPFGLLTQITELVHDSQRYCHSLDTDLLITKIGFIALSACIITMISAHAETNTVTGTNGTPGNPGSNGTPATATAVSTDRTNTATATGGSGGPGNVIGAGG